MPELGGSGRLPRAVDADEANDFGLVLADVDSAFGAFEYSSEYGGADLGRVFATDFLVGFVCGLDLVDDFLYSFNAEIRGVEGFFELIERVWI